MIDRNIEDIDVAGIRFLRRYGGDECQVRISSLYGEYHGLDHLINYNYGERDRSGKLDRQGFMHEWEQALPGDLFAVIPFTDGTTTELAVRYRTNMSPNLRKIPNILYLQQEDGEIVYVVRRGVSYDERVLENVEDTLKLDIDSCLHYGDIADELDSVHLPEPLVTSVLEEFYAQGFPRVTPPYVELNSGRFLLLKGLDEATDRGFGKHSSNVR